jgi:hypothetical protein
VVVASGADGVGVTGDNNIFSKNYIGTIPSNEAEELNANCNYGNAGAGLRIEGSGNRIGGSDGLKNYIACSGGAGIALVGGGSSTKNNFAYNSFHGNGQTAIDLGDNGVTQPGSGAENDAIDFPTMVRSLQFGTNNFVIQGLALAGSEVLIYMANPSDADATKPGG